MAELNKAVLYKIDCEKGEGIEYAKKYGIFGYPTFVMVNSSEEPIDRWLGYDKEYFIEMMNAAFMDLSTVDEKLKRNSAAPSIADAKALGRYYLNSGENSKAYGFYVQAQQLNTDPETDYTEEIFEAASEGYFREQISYADVMTAGENLLKDAEKIDIAYTCRTLSNIAAKEGDTEAMKKFFEMGLEASAEGANDDIRRVHNLLQVDYNLKVTADTAKAVEFKKATLRENWTETAGGLNGFAWWCYEHNANLGEAEILARKAVEMAEAGSQKAMILDTVAHICKAKGNYEEAIKLMKQAMAEEPDNKQWGETLSKFEEEMKSS